MLPFLKRTLHRCSCTAVFTLVVGLTVTLILSIWTYRMSDEQERGIFDRYANARVSAVRQRLFDVIGALQSLNQSFATFGVISRAEFHAITLPLLERYPYVQAFDFHLLISRADRPAFEARMGKIFPGYRVTDWEDGRMVPARDRETYRVVDYIEPLDRNEIALGFDAASNPQQTAAAERARDTGLASVSGVLRLTQRKEVRRGFIILMPVYRSHTLLVDTAARRKAIVGYTGAVLRADDFIQKSLDFAELPIAPGGEIAVYAGTVPSAENLVFRNGSPEHNEPRGFGLMHRLFSSGKNSVTRTIDVAGTPWSIVLTARKTPLIQYQYGSLLTLILGTLFSIVAAAYVQVLASRSQRIQRLVEERTAELQRVNANLNRDVEARQRAEKAMQEAEERLQEIINMMPVALFAKDTAGHIILMNQACEQQWGIDFRDVKNTDATEFFPQEQMSKFLRDDQAVFTNRQMVDSEESVWNARLQETRTVHTYKKPVFDQKGNPRYLIGLCVDITERKRVEEALRESQTLLRRLASHQNEVKESERQRIAREIHDDLGQNLLVLRIDASMLQARTAGHPRLNQKVTAALNQIDVIMKSVRTIINDLRPSVLDLGLFAAIEWQVRDFERRSGITCSLHLSGDEVHPGDKRALELFRILQESLTNVLRHAQATEVHISLTTENDRLFLRIMDNGVGIFPDCRRKTNSFGLLGIEERVHTLGGVFSMGNEAGKGLSLTVTVPLESASSEKNWDSQLDVAQ
jgi:PAS domain S-box-containing protein